jgi:hypothetical protein
VMLAQRESQHATGGRVHHRGDSVESELSQLSVFNVPDVHGREQGCCGPGADLVRCGATPMAAYR